MRRILSLAAAVLFLFAGYAAAEGQKAPDFIMEGFDGENSTRRWDSNLFFKRMEEQTGISFEFREHNQYSSWQNRKQEIVSGTDLPDVLFKAELESGEIRDMYGAGVLIDLKPLLEANAPDLWKLLQEDPEAMAAVTMPDGAIPALPAFNELQNNDVMWINTKWLSRLGLEAPADAEGLKKVLTAFRDGDPNGNGKKDEVPLAFISMWELRFLGHAFGITDNDYYISAKDGKVTSSLASEQNRAFLSWLHELWEEKLIDRRGFSMADSMRQITDENAAIPYGIIMSSSPLTVIPAKSLSQYELLLPLQYNGERKYRDLAGHIAGGTFAVTRRCKEPEKLVRWVNLLYTEAGALMAQYGLEGQEYNFREDGLWEWAEDMNTVTQEILTERTIGTGGASVPGISPSAFQTLYSDAEAREDISQLLAFRQYTVLPYPPVIMDKADEQEAARIQKDLSAYAETAMARFVTGDVPLDDEQWEIFCRTVDEKGLQKIIGIFQKYLKN